MHQVLRSGHLQGPGPFNELCMGLLREHADGSVALTTPSGTHALELAALVLDLQPGDEVIMPSFTFVSTANAFALRGAVPVFVDIRPDTLNLDESLLEDAVSERTRAVVPVHYAGVACEMDTIMRFARSHEIAVVEDAAHAIGGRYRGQALGAIGDLGCLSFDGQKNVSCGEGGALLIGNQALAGRAINLQAKGTNRAEFMRGEVDRYEWIEVSSSFLPSELAAAFLAAQLERLEELNQRRLHNWDLYRDALRGLEQAGHLRMPAVPPACEHNAHIFWIALADADRRPACLQWLTARGIEAPWHYVPLHSSPGGRRLGRVSGELSVTDAVAGSLLRLPVHAGLSEDDVAFVVEALDAFFVDERRPASITGVSTSQGELEQPLQGV
jgi:dTDP-4-amino-4,6-dideoxygalactose transaminase